MKKILLSIVVIAVLVGCGDNSESKKALENVKKEAAQINNENKRDAAFTPKITVKENSIKVEKDNPFISYDLDGNRVVRVAPDGDETPVTKELGALISIKNNYEKLNIKILAQRLSKNYMQKCSACHDNYANGVIGPSLLDKNEDEIFKSIKVYQTGEKQNILMRDLIKNMHDDEIRSLAIEISKLNKEVRESK